MTQEVQPRPLLTVKQAAARRLNTSEKTIRRRIAAGELVAVQLGPRGSSVRVDEGDLDEWLQGHRL